MIYLVTAKQELFESDLYKIIDVEESLRILNPLKIVGLDTETSSLDVHTGTLLTLQLGDYYNQVVIDCTSIDIITYKEYLESDRLFIAHNYKFDGKWLIDKCIYIRNVYDTFISEKVIYLGLPMKFSLQEVAKRYLNIWLDKSVRGDIIVNGLSEGVIEYAAKDVKYLEKIYDKQQEAIKENGISFAVKLECAFVSTLAYMEYCGIKLDVDKWRYKMSLDEAKLNKAEEELNNWVIEYCKETNNLPMDIWNTGKKNPKYPSNVYAVQPQLSLFEEFNEGPKCILNWNSSKQLVPLFEELGFDVWTKDKETGKMKKSVDTRLLKLQEEKSSIVKLYLDYSTANKRTTSFGQNFINALNYKTNRLHPEFNQLISSGRMSCGKGNSDSDDLDNLSDSVNIQQLPNDHLTRECFIAEKGNKIIAADYSDQEGHQFANLTQDKAWIDFYNDTSGRDGHSFVAKMIFKEELKDVEEKDIKKLRPDLRQKAKAPRFTFNYRGTPKALQANTGLPLDECEKMFDNYFSSFPGIKSYFATQEKDMWNKGYIKICQFSGMKSHIPNWKEYKWLDTNKNNIPNLWDYYKEAKLIENVTLLSKSNCVEAIRHLKEGYSLLDASIKANCTIPELVYSILRRMFKLKASYANKSANMPSQGSSAHMTKTALINYYKSIVERGLVHKCLIINAVHDEGLIEVPEEIAEQEANIFKECMEKASKFYCRSVEIKAVPEIGDYWIH